jgi:asparagine synthase (glutamine-hydrolysing)
MCGILVSSGLTRAFHHRLLKSLRKRGPDEIGFWADDRVQMAHTRLAVIGLDERGVEPLENETHVLAFNGEIYNFTDIKRQLNAQGVPVTGANDGEVLLHGWTHWGKSVLTQLTGFWSFVIYDKQRRTLTLVRDQLGIKPLYYWRSGEQVCVSSMIRPILDVIGTVPSLDYEALSEYGRYQFTFGDKTFLSSVKKVLPGHLVEINLSDGGLRDELYEDILASPENGFVPLTRDWIDTTRELVTRCVVASTISDTSFTTFCSGGLDSSLITRLARPEIAYHCNYSDPDCNETFYAQQVVKGNPERLFVVNAQEEFNLVDRLRDIVSDFDELSVGSVVLPLDDLLAQVKRRYKVILTGTGGDELFAGYVRYQLVLGDCFQDSYRGLFNRMSGIKDPVDRFEFTNSKGDTSRFRFYQPDVETTFRDAYEECRSDGSELAAMLRFDRRYFLAGLLNIDDKMCGRHSLESRPSFLHQELVRHVQKLNPGSLLSNGDLKPVLREIAAPTLPKSVIYRADKMGFTTPIGTFVNRSSGYIREQLINSRFRDLYDLRKMSLTAETKFSREVFGLLMLDLWLNEYAGAC